MPKRAAGPYSLLIGQEAQRSLGYGNENLALRGHHTDG